ncbi:MAG TPA: copper-binding protein [Ferrovaceae bacterium]|nr:copper-binding protein [Ferrovaceae bacterium]HQU06326.1 copper-binding protein [Ferrovaceae bacterium]
MNWPAMTTGFQVKDKKLLDKLTVGKTVDFKFTKADAGYEEVFQQYGPKARRSVGAGVS